MWSCASACSAYMVKLNNSDADADAALWQVPVMVRVEVEKTQRLQFQVTVASPDGNTTSSLKDSICQLLAKL